MPRTSALTDEILMPEQVADDYLGIPIRTLDYWRYVGKGPRFFKAGKYVRYRRSAVEEWIAEQEAEAAR